MAKKFYRSTGDRMIGGVCGGLARYLDWDPTLVRIISAVLILFSNGIGLLAYILTWILAPEDESDGEPARHADSEQRRRIVGGVLIGVGGLLLIGQFVAWFDFKIVMAVVLVAAGVYIIVQKR
jgi:phage shock protein C